MKTQILRYLIVLLILVPFIDGCGTSAKTGRAVTTSNTMPDSSMKPESAITQKSGAQLWGENCVRCHNAPPPTAYSDDQWPVIRQHMRIRANISQQEIDKIVEFIKSAN